MVGTHRDDIPLGCDGHLKDATGPQRHFPDFRPVFGGPQPKEAVSSRRCQKLAIWSKAQAGNDDLVAFQFAHFLPLGQAYPVDGASSAHKESGGVGRECEGRDALVQCGEGLHFLAGLCVPQDDSPFDRDRSQAAPSGANLAVNCFARAWRHLPCGKDHTRTVPSVEPVARREPSGEKDSELTLLLCPSNTPSALKPGTDQRRTQAS